MLCDPVGGEDVTDICSSHVEVAKDQRMDTNKVYLDESMGFIEVNYMNMDEELAYRSRNNSEISVLPKAQPSINNNSQNVGT